MEKISEQGRLRPWMGFVLFGVLMAFFIFACAPLQNNLGIPGLVITEFAFLVIAVIYCLIRKVKIREVFPIRKVKVREIFGSLLLVIGAFPLSLLFVAITASVFPWSLKEVGDLTSFVYGSLNYPMAVLIVALMPAVCEEAIHRGAILSNFRSLKRDWVIILIMGLLFGINHLSVLRFLPTMFLGIMLSYVVVKRNNIILSMLMHFTNNFISVSVTYLFSDASSTATAVNVDYSKLIGSYLVLAFASPILITLGMMLVNPEGHKKIRFLFAGILSTVMFISGTAYTAVVNQKNVLLNSTISYTVTAEDKIESTLDFTVEEECESTVAVVLLNAEGDYTVRIDGDTGVSVINAPVPKGMIRMMTYNVKLPPDHYVVTIEAGDNAVGEHPQIEITVQ